MRRGKDKGCPFALPINLGCKNIGKKVEELRPIVDEKTGETDYSNQEFNFKEFPKREIFKKIDHFFCISQNTKNDLIEYYNIDESKISVTYLASSIRASKKNLKSYSKPFLLYVGSRKRYKNFRLLLEAYSKLDKIKKTSVKHVAPYLDSNHICTIVSCRRELS